MTRSELDELLDRVGRLRFVEHCFRVDRHGPDVVAFVHEWRGGAATLATADVVILFDEDRAGAFRTASGPGIDVFAPALVSWWYRATPVWTLRAVIALPQPGHPDEPRRITPPPPDCTLPTHGRKPTRVRIRQQW